MKEIKNKSIVVGALVIAVVMIVAVLGGCGSNRYVFDENDFRLTIEVDKTEARVGDTVVATARFENLSGRDLRVYTRKHPIRAPEYLLQVFERTESSKIIEDATNFSRNRIPRFTIKKDMIFENQIEFAVENQENYIVRASVGFRLGREQIVSIFEEIAITIQGDK